MKKINIDISGKDKKRLLEIFQLKMSLQEIRAQKGPANPDYITLSLKLERLMQEYIDGKLVGLQHITNDEIMKKDLKGQRKIWRYMAWQKATPGQYFTCKRNHH